MKKLTVLLMLLLGVNAFAQHAPIAEPVYGGYIEDIDAIPITADSTRVFIATRSANGMFYTDIDNSGGAPAFTSFTVVPDFDVTHPSSYIKCLAADENSHEVFAAFEFRGLVGANLTPGSLYTIEREPVEAVEAYYGYLFYLKLVGPDAMLYYAPISSSGVVGTANSVLVQAGYTWSPRFKIRIIVNPSNNHVYVFIPGSPPVIYESSDAYNSFSSTTTFSLVPINDLITSGHDYVSMGIAPDGRLFAAAYTGDSHSFNAWMAYTDYDGDPWTINVVTTDIGRGKFSIVGTSSNYYVYYSRAASDDKGATWKYEFIHADGAVAGDPNNPTYSYGRSDWGMDLFGLSSGRTEINDGIQAVEVKALGMNVGKDQAWVATKSGIWHVTHYGSPSPTWSGAPIWPQGDSYPYSSAVCTPSGDTVYVGNIGGKLYRYEASSGTPDDPANWEKIFDAETISLPSWTWTYGTRVSAISIDHSSATERIFIGLYDDEDWDETTEHYGGVFVGENTSSGWNWYEITSSSVIPDGIDVNDIINVVEGGHKVLYVAVERNTSYTPTVNGVYRMEETSPGNWTVTQDLYLSASYPLAASILDIAKSPNDTIYVCGTDASTSNPTIYKKAIGDTYWTTLSSTLGGPWDIARSITADPAGNIYVAVNNKIFEYTLATATWSVYATYPLGTEINFIYYDDLLVGTGTGLYVHPTTPNAVEETKNEMPSRFTLSQNYPNPFSAGGGTSTPTTTIKYSIPAVGTAHELSLQTRLIVYDILGRKVATLVNKTQAPGNYSVQFNAENLPSGIYFYTLQAGNFVKTRKMILLK